jgi:hypothetical protein
VLVIQAPAGLDIYLRELAGAGERAADPEFFAQIAAKYDIRSA